MKKIVFYITTCVLALSINSCQRDMTSLNNDPKHPSVLPSSNLLASGQYQAAYYMSTGSVNNNNYRFFVQQWAETTYTDETNYDLVTRNQPRNHYNRMMINTLNFYKTGLDNLAKESNDGITGANKWATLEISSIFVWENLVDTFGDIPYTDALKINDGTLSPKYDDAKAIYTDLLKRLDIAISKINTSGSGYSSGDLFYGGDMSKWKKFANSIKLRLAMNLADVDPATSKSAAEAAVASGVMTSNSDSYSFKFDSGTFTSPIYDDLVASGRNDFVPTSVVVDYMNTTNDPRRSVWFTTVGGAYKGGKFGSLNTFANFSHMSSTLTAQTAPANLLGYAEVLFLETEAAQRGYSVGSTASALYTNAITASMSEYGVSSSDATAFVTANPYDATNWKTSIGKQAWIALFNSPFAAWNFTRRLDAPVFANPANSKTDGVPVRMPYSDQEYVLNKANVNAAATKIGGDKVTTHLFWDKY